MKALQAVVMSIGIGSSGNTIFCDDKGTCYRALCTMKELNELYSVYTDNERKVSEANKHFAFLNELHTVSFSGDFRKALSRNSACYPKEGTHFDLKKVPYSEVNFGDPMLWIGDKYGVDYFSSEFKDGTKFMEQQKKTGESFGIIKKDTILYSLDNFARLCRDKRMTPIIVDMSFVDSMDFLIRYAHKILGVKIKEDFQLISDIIKDKKITFQTEKGFQINLKGNNKVKHFVEEFLSFFVGPRFINMEQKNHRNKYGLEIETIKYDLRNEAGTKTKYQNIIKLL